MKWVVVIVSVLIILAPRTTNAQGFERQVMDRLIAAGVPQAQVTQVYDDFLIGIYRAAARVSDPVLRRSPQYAASGGRLLLDLPGMQQWALNRIPAGGGQSLSAFRAALRTSSSQLKQVLAEVAQQNQYVRQYVDDVVRAVTDVSMRLGCLSGCSVINTLRHRATAGGKPALKRIAASVGAKFGTFLEWLSSHTGQRILGIYTIADYTQGHINEALYAFQDEMEAIGDAYEAEAFNNNVGLMMDSLKAGKTCLREGMTLALAVRQLRKNLNLGPPFFANIIEKCRGAAQTAELPPVPPATSEESSTGPATTVATAPPTAPANSAILGNVSSGLCPGSVTRKGQVLKLRPTESGPENPGPPMRTDPNTTGSFRCQYSADPGPGFEIRGKTRISFSYYREPRRTKYCEVSLNQNGFLNSTTHDIQIFVAPILEGAEQVRQSALKNLEGANIGVPCGASND